MSAWTQAEDEWLHALEALGYSASLIAERMGRSREAVIGRSNRLRGGRRGLKAKPRTIVTRIHKVTPPPPNSRAARAARAPLPVPPVDGKRRMIGIFELTPTSCRWPHGDRAPYLFCGAPRMDAGCSYCEGHARLTHRRA
jgi:GcrA cell cycle regulator